MNLHITPSFNIVIDRLCKTASVLFFLVKATAIFVRWDRGFALEILNLCIYKASLPQQRILSLLCLSPLLKIVASSYIFVFEIAHSFNNTNIHVISVKLIIGAKITAVGYNYIYSANKCLKCKTAVPVMSSSVTQAARKIWPFMLTKNGLLRQSDLLLASRV